jgi:hypothetical protein
MLGTGHGDQPLYCSSLAEMDYYPEAEKFIDLSVSGWAERGKTVYWSLVPGGRVYSKYLGGSGSGSVDPETQGAAAVLMQMQTRL